MWKQLAWSLATEASDFNLVSCLEINSELIHLRVMTLEKAREVNRRYFSLIQVYIGNRNKSQR